jgi:CheY-like chemotaxis protein
MSDPVKLPAPLELTAAMSLVGDLRKVEGDVRVDTSAVTHLGGLCLQALGTGDFEVHIADDGIHGLEVLDALQPDAIITDINIP